MLLSQGRKGDWGPIGVSGAPGRSGPVGPPGPPGRSGPPSTDIFTGFLLTRHSQDVREAMCPAGTRTLWQGYSLLYIEGNEKSHHQDLGTLSVLSAPSFRIDTHFFPFRHEQDMPARVCGASVRCLSYFAILIKCATTRRATTKATG